MGGERPGRSDDSGFRFEDVSVVAPDGTQLLSHIGLLLPRTGITAIVGPSGAGKSTLLRLCNRLEVPSAGRVLLDGVDLADLDPLALRRRVGLVFQRPVVFGGTVRDNLRVAVADLADEMAAAVLGSLGLSPELLDRSAGELSGGEAQRLCLARTLVTEPEVLLLDEPTSAVDPERRAEVERLARRAADRGVMVVWVTHDLPQARRCADRTVVLDGGRVCGADDAGRYLAGEGGG